MKGFKNLLEIEKVRCGLISSWQYCCRGKTHLAKSHVLSSYCLQHEVGNGSLITCADLEQVENRYLLVGKCSGGISIYDTHKLKDDLQISKVARINGGSRFTHTSSISCLHWYPVDAGIFSSSGLDKRVKVWDPNTMKMVEDFKFDFQIYNHHMSPVAPYRSLLAVAGGKGEVIICDLRTGSSSHRMHGHDGPVHVVQWARYNQHCLASGGTDQTIRLWDVRSAKSCLKILDADNTPPETSRYRKRAKRVPLAHSSRIASLCFTHDGLWLISFSSDGGLKVWDSNNWKNMNVNFGEVSTDLQRPLSIATSFQTHPDLVYVPSLSKILVFEVPTGKLVNTLEGHLTSVLGVVFNPLSSYLYSFGSDRHFLVWSPRDLVMENDIEDSCLSNDSATKKKTGDSWSSDEG